MTPARPGARILRQHQGNLGCAVNYYDSYKGTALFFRPHAVKIAKLNDLLHESVKCVMRSIFIKKIMCFSQLRKDDHNEENWRNSEGCGVYDGSEIHEAVLTLLAIHAAVHRRSALHRINSRLML